MEMNIQQQQQSPPSSSSSPTHEFSFTVSVHPTTEGAGDKASAAFAVDLTPADEIFFHGHLLPLHLLSNFAVSPRASTNSMDSFILPIRELLQEDSQVPKQNTDENINITSASNEDNNPGAGNIKGRTNSKSFSLFGLSKWRKGCEVREKENKDLKRKMDNHTNSNIKPRFDVSHVLKGYMRMFRPLLSFRGEKSGDRQLHRQSYSFSANPICKSKRKLTTGGRREEYSAPASVRTSSTNSGLLVATGPLPTSKSDSTMVELQAAIQAAIAHCKNSIAMEEDKNQIP